MRTGVITLFRETDGCEMALLVRYQTDEPCGEIELIPPDGIELTEHERDAVELEVLQWEGTRDDD